MARLPECKHKKDTKREEIPAGAPSRFSGKNSGIYRKSLLKNNPPIALILLSHQKKGHGFRLVVLVAGCNFPQKTLDEEIEGG